MQGHYHFQPKMHVKLDLDSLIPSHHLLRRIDKEVDFGFIRTLTAPYYSQNQGRPSLDPEIFFRIIIVGYLYGITSDRQLCEELQYNLAYRWFCKLSLGNKIPDHSSLTRIRDRLGVEVFQAFFDNILHQCKEKGLVKGERILTDSTLIAANASLDSMQANTPDLVHQVPPVKKDYHPGLSAPPARKISNKTHTSHTDPQASLAFKEGTVRGLKYKIHLSCDADSRVILAAKATTGACHDSQPYLAQLKDIQFRCAWIIIKEATADRAYGSAEIIEALLNLGIHPYIPLFSTRSGQVIEQEATGFVFESSANRYRCPAGCYLNPYPTPKGETLIYRTRHEDCRNCALKAQCTAKPMSRSQAHYLSRNIHQALYEHILAAMQTKVFLVSTTIEK